MKLLQIHQSDTVATCLEELVAGQIVEWGGESVTVRDPIPIFHKIAIVSMAEGSPCVKYGQSIGVATADIEPGRHVHTHNLASLRGRGDLGPAERE